MAMFFQQMPEAESNENKTEAKKVPSDKALELTDASIQTEEEKAGPQEALKPPEPQYLAILNVPEQFSTYSKAAVYMENFGTLIEMKVIRSSFTKSGG